jgi:hypothetical protein
LATPTLQGAAAATAPARETAATLLRAEIAAASAVIARAHTEAIPAVPQLPRVDAVPSAEAAPAVETEINAQPVAAGDAPVETQVESIKNAIIAQGKFLGELVANASRWEMSGGEVRIFFPTESRALADLLQVRDTLERLRNIASGIVGRSVRVCVKLEDVPAGGTPSNGTRELRAKFEQDPIVRAIQERFGGQISDVKRRGEE